MQFDLTKFHYYIEYAQYNDKIGEVVGWAFYDGEKLDLMSHDACANTFTIRREERTDVAHVFYDSKVEIMCGFRIYFVMDEDASYFVDAYVNGVFVKSIQIREKTKTILSAMKLFIKNHANWQGICSAIRILKNSNCREIKYKFAKEIFGIKNGKIKEIYDDWYHEQHACSILELAQQRKSLLYNQPIISIVVSVFNIKNKSLKAMIESVQKQTYTRWELCLVDASTDPDTYELIRKYINKDARIKICRSENKGISANTNIAISMATGDYIGFLGDEDLLAPEALFLVAKCIDKKQPDMMYSDEDNIDARGLFLSKPQFKPDFAPYTLRSFNYINHFLVVKKELQEQVGLLNQQYDGAQDYDFILRCSEQTGKIEHIAHILYHRRTYDKSREEKGKDEYLPDIMGINVLERHLLRTGIKGTVEEALENEKNIYHVKYSLQGKPLVSIIIPNFNNKIILERCINSVLQKTQYDNYEIIIVENNSTDAELFTYYKELEKNGRVHIIIWTHPFNYSALNNFAVGCAHGEFIVLLNNDTEILTKDWLEELLGVCQQPDVGAVGAKLFYSDGTIQHGGVIIGIGGLADHAYRGFPGKALGHMRRLAVTQNLSAVTAALLMTKKSLYRKVGGLDERYAVAFNDVDYCMKMTSIGKFIIFDPYVCAYHYESITRGMEDTPKKKARSSKEMALFHSKWGTVLYDPYYNVNLTKARTDYSF